MSEATELLDWAADHARRGVATIPEPVLRKAMLIVCDDLAAMIAAHTEDEVRQVSAQAVDGDESTVVGVPGRRTDRGRASVANAVAANWTELDGGYRPATCHGSLYTLPTALAEVEATNGSVGDLLIALVTGYEVVTRVARAYRPPLPLSRHPHASLSPIGAAAAVGAARRLPADAFARTVLGAASMSMTRPFVNATQGATVRNAWAAAASQLGFLAADMADAGLTGSPTAFREVFADVGGAAAREEELTQGLGERYGVQDAYHKPYACCQYLHSSVEAAGQLAKRIPVDKIVEIAVRAHPLAAALDNKSPETSLAARFSLPHAVAAVLLAGEPDMKAFARESLHEATVVQLRDRVRIEEWTDVPEPPHDRPSSVRVTLADGSVHEETVMSALGGPDRPMSREQLLDKFRTLTAELRPGFAAQAEALTDPDRPLDLDVPLRVVLDRLLGEVS